MSFQKSLTSFFKPVQTKRMSADSSELDVTVSAKKPKLENCVEKNESATTSEDTKQKITTPQSPSTSVKAESEAPSDVESSMKEKSEVSEDVKDREEVPNSTELSNSKCSTQDKDASVDEKSYSQRSTQEVKDDPVEKKGVSYSQQSTQEVKNDGASKNKSCDDTKNESEDTKVMSDITNEDKDKNNFTTPVKSESKFISTPLGMLSPLQCLARIKSQCAKTPALHHSIGPTWFFALQGEFTKPYFKKLSEFLVGERKKSVIYPPENQVWTWTQLSTIKEVKVVILGQDPYHNPGQAHGLCFSVQKGIPPPPSLINMYKELESDIPGFKAPKHGNLTGWAQQGVLLLNACLTVRANCANSHKDQGWEQLTDAVIKRISDTGNGVVFLLWGSYAHKKGSVVNKKKHHILQATHPSPLSAHRGFMGCKHFSKCNDLLKKGGKKPIDWAHLPLV